MAEADIFDRPEADHDHHRPLLEQLHRTPRVTAPNGATLFEAAQARHQAPTPRPRRRSLYAHDARRIPNCARSAPLGWRSTRRSTISWASSTTWIWLVERLAEPLREMRPETTFTTSTRKRKRCSPSCGQESRARRGRSRMRDDFEGRKPEEVARAETDVAGKATAANGRQGYDASPCQGPMIDAHRVTLAAPRTISTAGATPRAAWPTPACRPRRWSGRSSGDDGRSVRAAPDAARRRPAPSFAVPRAFIDLAKRRSATAIPNASRCSTRCCCSCAQPPGDGGPRRPAGPTGSSELAKEVRRDVHKMRAFVRFREVEDDGRHALRRLVRARASHRARQRRLLRPPLRHDALVDPDARAVDPLGRRDAAEGPGATRADAPDGDPVEEMWKTYYATIFNPARLKVGAMLKEMPKKYWKNMPETALIAPLIAGRAGARGGDDRDGAGARTPIARVREQPRSNLAASWEALRAEAARLHALRPLQMRHADGVRRRAARCARSCSSASSRATRRIWPGRPFVGPAGQVFDAALAEAGIDRGRDLRHQRGQAFQVRSSAASGASTPSPTPARSTPAAGGSSRSAR